MFQECDLRIILISVFGTFAYSFPLFIERVLLSKYFCNLNETIQRIRFCGFPILPRSQNVSSDAEILNAKIVKIVKNRNQESFIAQLFWPILL